MSRILVVDDDPCVVALIAELLEADGQEVLTALSADDGRRRVEQDRPDLVLVDIEMPAGQPTGLELLRHIRSLSRPAPVLMLTGHGTKDRAIQSLREGARDFVEKPFGIDDLLARIHDLLACAPVGPPLPETPAATDPVPPPPLLHFDAMVGESPAMQAVYRLIDRVAATDVTVLVLGESGTGKELVARALHACSRRARQPFVAINCAALPENLLESELFGHRKGAFTGAATDKTGLFESAAGGTVLLDEIGSMPLALQGKLLRFLQDRELRRVGDTATIRVDVRVIAATNEALPERMRLNQFREDLYYRLSVIPLTLPPLRQRAGDIPLLAGYFLRAVALREQRSAPRFAAAALHCLAAYPWPGNVRELQNVIERACLLGDSGVIGAADLPGPVAVPSPAVAAAARAETATAEIQDGGAQVSAGGSPSLPLKDYLQRVEADYIARAVRAADSNKQRAATLLGVSLTTLYRKLGPDGLPAPTAALPADG